jgi:hemolysin activation/secretion protein
MRLCGGQQAAQPSRLPERLALGGTRFGRAHDPAEITGDDAVASSLELRSGCFVENGCCTPTSDVLHDVGTV